MGARLKYRAARISFFQLTEMTANFGARFSRTGMLNRNTVTPSATAEEVRNVIVD